MDKNDREILCVPRVDFYVERYRTGHRPPGYDDGAGWLFEAIERGGEYRRRGDAERNVDYKQIIPYVVVKSPSRVLAYRRSDKGGESRLFHSWSIGFGGHVEAFDAEPAEGDVVATARRELAEELAGWGGDGPGRGLVPVGTIDDESDYGTEGDGIPVGMVHAAIVFDCNVTATEAARLRPLDPEIAEIRWMTLLDATMMIELFEPWSVHLIRALALRGIPPVRPPGPAEVPSAPEKSPDPA